MILSFHPCFVGDQNRLCAGREPDDEDLSAIRAAGAVILPQGCRAALHRMAQENCRHVFPNYHARFRYPGKPGQIRLFREMGLPHPRSRIYASRKQLAAELPAGTLPEGFELPFVLKFSWGGEGETVFLVSSEADFHRILDRVDGDQGSGQKGFVIQQYVPTDRCLRIVRIGESFRFYWRIAGSKAIFGTSVSGGARIDPRVDPEIQEEALRHLTPFCEKTGIDLAGFDVLFSDPSAAREPYFIEINYFFGRKGLGGSEAYYRLLVQEINGWLRKREGI